MHKITLISLGCAKNTVDGELMLGKLADDYIITDDPFESEIIIINTCGFIEPAKQESINTILEVAELKQTAKLKSLIVTGCLAQRYKDELADEIPEVDAFLGIDGWSDIKNVVSDTLNGKKVRDFARSDVTPDYLTRVLSTSPPTAYVRIADGCSNRCAFCAIPIIRGPLKSRPMEEIVEETLHLIEKGAGEIILIAQDTTKYGVDIYGKSMLCELLEKLAVIPEIKWLRLLYCYPENITAELLEVMCKHDNIVKYIDMPIQHFDDGILHKMNRTNTYSSTVNAVNMIRDASSEFIVRTTIITGFPGEGEEEFEVLKSAVRELKFDRLGCFAYSREEGTPAATYKGQTLDEVKQLRAQDIMTLQQGISLELAEARVGNTYDVLTEGLEEDYYYGRSYAEAPDIDGKVYFKSDKPPMVGEFIKIKITHADVYDIFGEVVY